MRKIHGIGIAVATVALMALAACGGGYGGGGGGSGVIYSSSSSSSTSSASSSSSTSFSAYGMTTLVASTAGLAANTDANLQNGWGVAFNPNGFVWVADNGTGKSTLYDGNGVVQSLVVSLPDGTAGAAHPTGIVFNNSTAFSITKAGVSGASAFIFSGEAGTISAWSPGVDATNTVTVYDGAATGTVYKGLAILNGSVNQIYATDFHNAHVDVFDSTFTRKTVTGNFADPNLPAGYAPYGIQAINGQLFVTFAQQDATATKQVKGAGLGIVDIFDSNGNLVKRLVTAGALNAPWGLAMAPANFGPFSNALLVGNFGDGTINAYDASTGAFLGTLKDSTGAVVTIPGLWGIAFGNGLNSQPITTLFFAAGPTPTTGSYGRIDPK